MRYQTYGIGKQRGRSEIFAITEIVIINGTAHYRLEDESFRTIVSSEDMEFVIEIDKLKKLGLGIIDQCKR